MPPIYIVFTVTRMENGEVKKSEMNECQFESFLEDYAIKDITDVTIRLSKKYE